MAHSGLDKYAVPQFTTNSDIVTPMGAKLRGRRASAVGATKKLVHALRIMRPTQGRGTAALSRELEEEQLDEALGDKDDKHTRARKQVREMLIYMVFVALFTFQTLQQRDSSLYFLTNSIREQFVGAEFDAVHEKTLSDVATVTDVYEFLQGPFIDILYTADSYDGDETYAAVASNSSSSVNAKGMISGKSWVVGGIRIGQTRVKHSTCKIPTAFSVPSTGPFECFHMSDDTLSDPEPFGTPKLFTDLLWQDPDEPMYSSPVTGTFFDGPNVYKVLPNPTATNAKATAAAVIKNMAANKFVDLKTRLVMIDMNFYHPSFDYTVIAVLGFELPVGGGVVPWFKLSTTRLYRDHTTTDVVRTVVEVVVMIMVVFYTYKEVSLVLKKGVLPYLEGFNIAHNLNLIFFYASGVYRILAFTSLPSAVNVSGNDFAQLRQTAAYLSVTEDLNAFNAFLTWLKVFMYLNFVTKFQILLGTLSRAAGKVSGFAFICAIVLFGSSQAFMLLFGRQIYGFRNLTQSFYTLIRALLGDFDFEALRLIQPVLGPIVFSLFIMLAVFVLLNMFIAIISDAFNETKDKLALMEDFGVETLGKHVAETLVESLEHLPFLGRPIRWLAQRMAFYRFTLLHQKHLKQLALLADANADDSVSPEEIAESLDKDANGEVTADEVRHALIASGASPEAAQQVLHTIPFDRHNVVSTDMLAEIFKAAKSTKPGDMKDGGAHAIMRNGTWHASGNGLTDEGSGKKGEAAPGDGGVDDDDAVHRNVTFVESPRSAFSDDEDAQGGAAGDDVQAVAALPGRTTDAGDAADMQPQSMHAIQLPPLGAGDDAASLDAKALTSPPLQLATQAPGLRKDRARSGAPGTSTAAAAAGSPAPPLPLLMRSQTSADRAMRAVNMLRIGIANKQLLQDDTRLAGLSTPPVPLTAVSTAGHPYRVLQTRKKLIAELPKWQQMQIMHARSDGAGAEAITTVHLENIEERLSTLERMVTASINQQTAVLEALQRDRSGGPLKVPRPPRNKPRGSVSPGAGSGAGAGAGIGGGPPRRLSAPAGPAPPPGAARAPVSSGGWHV